MSRTIIQMIGRTFGRAVVIEQCENQGRRLQYLCECSCGNRFKALGENLRSLHTQSCGCYQKAQIRKVRETHGESSFYNKSPEYKIWVQMRGRCNCKTNPRYPEWGGRGIKVCERWNDFSNFLLDMGRKPTPQHSIDRIDNNGNYEPSNCRWATKSEQNNNKSNNVLLTYKNRTQTMKQWSEELNMNYGTLQSRIDTGWTHEQALSIPVGESRL